MDILLVLIVALIVVLLFGVFLLHWELRQLKRNLLQSTWNVCGDPMYLKIQCLDKRLRDLDEKF